MSSSTHNSMLEMIARANDLAGKYEWMQAADIYKQIVDGSDSSSNLVDVARMVERLAECYFKSAFQAGTREYFKENMRLAETSHGRAAELYRKAGSDAASKRSTARALFASYWLSDRVDSRKEIVKKCLALADESAGLFQHQGETFELAQTRVDSLTYLKEENFVSVDWKECRQILENALAIGKQAISEFQALGDKEGLFRSVHLTLYILVGMSLQVFEPTKYGEAVQEISRLRKMLSEISQEIGTPLALALAGEVEGWIVTVVEGSMGRGWDVFRAALEMAAATKDLYLAGRLCFGLVLAARGGDEDVELVRKHIEQSIVFGKEAIRHFEILGGLYWPWVTYDYLADAYACLGLYVENELNAKIARLTEAVEVAKKGIRYEMFPNAEHALSKALVFLAGMEADPSLRKQFLADALRYREGCLKFFEMAGPFCWDRGVQFNYFALIKAEMSRIEPDIKTRLELLQSAVDAMEQCVSICGKWAMGSFYLDALGHYYQWYGDILVQLNDLRPENGFAERAIKAYQAGVSHVTKAAVGTPVGPVLWKIAKTYDSSGEYEEASAAFKKAGQAFGGAAKTAHGLEEFLNELASYMGAWSLIEEAKLHHAGEAYNVAAEKYAEASGILGRTRAWGYLSEHYSACSSVERGEMLSREDKSDESAESFRKAMKVFADARMTMETRSKKALSPQESEEIAGWLEITGTREKYSAARRELEEAKVQDRLGREEESAAKYRSASRRFKALLDQTITEESHRELETLMLFSEAWAKMKEAEVEASPEDYQRAVEAFDKAKEVTSRKKFRLLAMANASMCRALESGARFRLTRNSQFYSEIKRYLETAADYYSQGGFQTAADWTHATQRLFDALVYMANGEAEVDAKKKTEFFHLAEKHLAVAAELYGNAGFPSKREETLRQLKKVRSEKELLLTPVEALGENPALTRSEVATVSLVRDQAAGLERFETANVVGNLTLPQNQLGVGSDLTLELELANVGKTAATLMKLENVVPEGLEIDKEKIPQRVEDNYFDMKGKRLEYLKTHEVKIPMRTKRKGVFELKPRILFVDEKGVYRSYEFEPASITVGELGISGWLKGPK